MRLCRTLQINISILPGNPWTWLPEQLRTDMHMNQKKCSRLVRSQNFLASLGLWSFLFFVTTATTHLPEQIPGVGFQYPVTVQRRPRTL